MLIVSVKGHWNYKGCDFIEVLKYIFVPAVEILNCKIDLFGYSFTFFDCFVFGFLVSIVSYVVYRIFDN